MQKRTRIKICGMTRVEDAETAVELGVDAIGMILHAKSPRTISVAQAQMIRAHVPAFVSLVGVFVDCPAQTINEVASIIGLDLVQLHGAETNDFGARLNAPFIKAIRAKSIAQVRSQVTLFPDSRALLLDPYVKGKHGGTGQVLDPQQWPNADQKLILAGGLSPDNVADAIRRLKPFAVDLNSGVEAAPGIKDAKRLASALDAIASVDNA